MIIGIVTETGQRVATKDIKEGMTRTPLPIVKSMIRKDELDVRHSGPNITVTAGIGCPRQWAVSRLKDCFFEPDKAWAMQRGTWCHEHASYAMESLVDDNGERLFYSEEADHNKCVFHGEIFGIKMSCLVDAYRRDLSEVWDFKFRSPFGARWIDPEGRADEKDIAQMNMIRLLMEQNTGEDLSRMGMTVWVDAGGWYKTWCPVVSEEALGDMRLAGAKQTLREHFQQLQSVCDIWDEYCDGAAVPRGTLPSTVDANEWIRALPMEGENMFKNRSGGNACRNYCQYKDMCYDADGGI